MAVLVKQMPTKVCVKQDIILLHLRNLTKHANLVKFTSLGLTQMITLRTSSLRVWAVTNTQSLGQNLKDVTYHFYTNLVKGGKHLKKRGRESPKPIW